MFGHRRGNVLVVRCQPRWAPWIVGKRLTYEQATGKSEVAA